MAYPVYSAPFIQYTPAAPNLSFEVPPGFTAVCRYGTFFQAIGAYAGSFYFQDSVDAPDVTFFADGSIGASQVASWEGRVVVPENGIISAFISEIGDDVAIYLGGYLLRNAAT